MLYLVVVATILGLASAGFQLKDKTHDSLEVAGKDQQLRVCNAFPSGPLSVFYKGEELTDSEGLDYSECSEFLIDTESGGKIDVRSGNKSGIFTVWDVPKCGNAVLLLVAFRREDTMNSVSFLSHVFCPAKTSQVAVIDAYNDKSSIDMSIQKLGGKAEELSFDTAMGLSSGSYRITSQIGKKKEVAEFQASPSESYVVLRTGWASSDKNKSIPQQVVIYPWNKVKENEDEKSGARSWSASTLCAASMAMLLLQ